AAKPRRLASAAGMIVWFSTITSVICRLLDFNEKVASQNSSIHFLIFVGVLIFVYLITCIFTVIILRPNKKLLSNFGIAALNTLVLAIPLINYRSAMTLWESIGTGFGSGIAFVLASLLIGAGFTKLSKEKRIPKAFRGAPVMFIYVAMLSLAFMGISGSGVFA
ncbi:MAG: hypothetical protein MJ120_02750, partial [Clostridia bacterium]|nr:hypothetical protein [Clostridia bacterium]